MVGPYCHDQPIVGGQPESDLPTPLPEPDWHYLGPSLASIVLFSLLSTTLSRLSAPMRTGQGVSEAYAMTS